MGIHVECTVTEYIGRQKSEYEMSGGEKTTRARVTLRDIASAVGVSISTVSLALRNDPRVSDGLRQSIQSTAEELGYTVNLLGSMMRSSAPPIVGVVGRFDQELHAHYIRILGQEARKRGYHLIAENAAVYASMAEALNTLAQFRVTTTIAINPDTDDYDETLQNEATVVIGQERVFPSADLLTSSNDSGAEELARHLHTLGHRHLAYFDGAPSLSAEYRRNSVIGACDDLGIRVDVIPAGSTMDDGFLAASQLMADHWAKQGRQSMVEQGRLGEYSAIVAYNDQCAQGVAVALLGAGVRIPEDISLVGFDNSLLAQSLAFSLTSVDRGVEGIATSAIERAIEHINHPDLKKVTISVDSHLVVRMSTGRAFYLNSGARNLLKR